MNRFNSEAIVLKNIKYQDADKIFTLFTKERGKLSALAKGVRKITSRRAGSLDTLSYLKIQISPHISGQNYITETELLKSFKTIKSDYVLTKIAFYLTELIDIGVWADENTTEVFDLIISTLTKLETAGNSKSANNGDNLGIIVNKFEIKLMQLLGYEPPAQLLLMWRERAKQKDFKNADLFVKNYVLEILQKNPKSLELD